MFTCGMKVRRERRFNIMTIVMVEGNKITCEWTNNGKVFKRTFDEKELIVLTLSLNSVL